MIEGDARRESSAPVDAMTGPVVRSVDFPATTIVLSPATLTFGEGSFTSPTNVKVEWLNVADVKVRGPYGRVLRVTFDQPPVFKPRISVDLGLLMDGLERIGKGLVLGKLVIDRPGVPDQWVELQNLKLEEDGLSSKLSATAYDLASDGVGKAVVTIGVLLSCAREDVCVPAHQMSCRAWCPTERPTFNCGMGSLCQ